MIVFDESLTVKAQIRCRICHQPAGGDLFSTLRASPVSPIQQPILCVNNVAQARFQLRAMKPLNVKGVYLRLFAFSQTKNLVLAQRSLP